MKFNQPKYVVAILFIFAVITQLMLSLGKWLDLKDSLAVFTSALITASGWYLSAYLNHRSFVRGEIIKNKDRLVILTESFFIELEKLISQRETTEKDLEDFIADKTTEISLKSTQLRRGFKQDVEFLSDSTISKLQNEPIDNFNFPYKEQNQHLRRLRTSVLEEIDKKFDAWLEKL